MAQRIATLLPSATEIVCALGLADQLVGISHECDYPREITHLPALTKAKIDPSGRSGEIDRRVRALVDDGLSVYHVLEDELRAAAPDLIVTQDQCEVCAVSFAEVEQRTRAILGNQTRILSLSPNTVEDILADFERVAAATDTVEAGTELVAGSRRRLERIAAGAARARSKPRVACIEWLDPPMIAANWIPEMVRACGAVYDLAEGGTHSRTATWQEIADSAPDVIILMPCGFDLEQTRRELGSLREAPGWSSLPAVRNRRVYSVDGNAYFNRPGPRIVDSAEIIAGLVQPDLFASLLPAGSWERVE
jgi:iron complex transport system substrate-binding protein